MASTLDIPAALAETVRLLSATGTLPPTGWGRAAIRQDSSTLITSDLQGLGPLGDGDPNLSARGTDLATTVLRVRTDQGAALLTHAPYSTAWGLARRPLPVRFSPLIRFTSDEAIPVVHAADETTVLNAFRTNPSLKALLIPGQGILVLGQDLIATARALIGIEEAARLAWQAESIGGQQAFPHDAGERVARGIATDAA